ncbi:MAG: lysophospholipid acyltransferase family protein [Cytophagaceae bacterium]|nr:lysophospholipid acyltransferase family protein [Cytophagaceae bacterium]MBP6093066.1 lysophospholipid acyltransferase family protein [Cytophagaceae bacterium]
MPLSILYTLATGVKWVFYYIIAYRKEVISKNISNSFPQLKPKQIKALSLQFYGYLTDQLVEFFYGVSISEKEMLDRVQMVNEHYISDYLQAGTPVVLVAGHQGNWEWAIHRLALSNNLYDVVYQKLNNPSFNQFTMDVRSRFPGVTLLEKRESILATRERKDIARGICLAADQAPQKPESAYWTNFLNQDTAFFTGMERFARDYNYPVVFVELIRKERGKYIMSFEPIANPDYTDLPKGEIIERFARRLEKSIIQYPEQYLWSHRRWKHTKPDILSFKW